MKIAYRVSVIAGLLAAGICGSALHATAQTQPVTACVKPGSGLLRIPPPGEGCKPEETPLSFNDFPLLVALQTRLVALESAVGDLQTAVGDLQKRVEALEACIVEQIPQCSNPD